MSFSRKTIEEIKIRLQNHADAHFETPFLLRYPEICALVDMLKDRPDILSVDLSGCDIDDEGAKKLVELKHLTHLDVQGAEFDNRSALMLMLELKNLEWIDLSGNLNLNDELGKKILSGCVGHVVVVVDTPTMSMKMRASIRDRNINLSKQKTRPEGLAEESRKDIALDEKEESKNSVSRTANIYAELRLSVDSEKKKGFVSPTTTRKSSQSALKEPEEIKSGSPQPSLSQKSTSIFNRWFSWLSKRKVVANIENTERDNLIKLR
jgi:hypothetical protein